MSQRNSLRTAGRVIGIFLGLLWAYAAAGSLIAFIPAPRATSQGPRDIAIWVEDNGIHTGIVLPKALMPPDLLARFAARDLRDPSYAGHRHLAIGWGDRAFYIGTPEWRDLRPGVVLAAAIGSDATVLHVEHVAHPVEGGHVARVMLDRAGLDALVAAISASLDKGEAVAGYGEHDAFYPATGRYSAITTCNAWTGAALRKAGVPIGIWTPFSNGVMRWL